jgi:hypothetical protein
MRFCKIFGKSIPSGKKGSMYTESAAPAIPVTSTETLAASTLSELRAAATDSLHRGFAIFACLPSNKQPYPAYAPHGFQSASRDSAIALKPYADGIPANYGIDCGGSNLTVIDCDHGFTCASDFINWCEKNQLPATFTVRTGRRTNAKTGASEFGVQMYYKGAVPSTVFNLDGVTGEVKSQGGYVIGAGSVHPSGFKYEIIKDGTLADTPEVFKTKPEFKPELPTGDTGMLVPESQRNARLTSLAGTLRNQHLGEETIFAALEDFAIHQCEDGEAYFVKEEAKLKNLAHRAVTKMDAEPLPGILVFGKPGEADTSVPAPQGYCMTAEEWMAYDFSKEESEPLIGTAANAIIRPMTKNLIIAPDKAFKTTFLMRVMAGLAAGITVYDELPVQRACKIVYFHAELNPAELKQRITASVVSVDTHRNFVNVRDIRVHLINKTGQQFIVDTLETHKPDVVVFDPWQELISGFNENDQKDTSIARSFIGLLIDTFKCTAFLIQHMGNDEAKGGRGHSGMKGWRDTLITLTRTKGESHVHVKIEPRWGSPVSLDLTLQDGTLQPTFATFSNQQKNLIAFLKANPNGVTPKQLGEHFKMVGNSVYQMTHRAEDDDIVEKVDGLIFLKASGGVQ